MTSPASGSPIEHDPASVALDGRVSSDLVPTPAAPPSVPLGSFRAPSKDGMEQPTRATTKSAKIMIVDDEPINIKVVQKYLQGYGYSKFCTTTDSTVAFEMVKGERPDIILLDIMMPEVSGLEILQQVRETPRFRCVPVIILTAVGDASIKQEALQLGATDFLTKPVDQNDLVLRVGNAVVVKAHYDHLEDYSVQLERQVRARTAELMSSRRGLVQTLARAAEYRDNETAHHISRVGRFVGIIARELGMPGEIVELLEEASLLHDVGKIGIPDAILLKPGSLTDDEYETMRQHCAFGRRIIQPSHDSGWERYGTRSQLGLIEPGNTSAWLIPVAATIAQTHHEHWDGSGYPLGLKGEQIPIEGRITAVADVFDALGSKRPYKPAYSREKCIEILKRGHGSHFDPTVLDAFLRRSDEVMQVQIDLADVR